MQPIQMQWSQNEKIFSQLFAAFPASASKLEFFEKEDEPQRLLFSEIRDSK